MRDEKGKVLAQFLTQDWLSALTEAVNAHDGFKNAIADIELTLQFEVTDAPEGSENRYYIAIGEGSAEAAAGDAEDPDASIANDYETATAISKGDHDSVAELKKQLEETFAELPDDHPLKDLFRRFEKL